MTNENTSYVEMLRKFGSDIGLPKIDVDKLIESLVEEHRCPQPERDRCREGRSVGGAEAARNLRGGVAGGDETRPACSDQLLTGYAIKA